MNVLSAPRQRRREGAGILLVWLGLFVAAWAILAGVVFGVYELMTKVWP